MIPSAEASNRRVDGARGAADNPDRPAEVEPSTSGVMQSVPCANTPLTADAEPVDDTVGPQSARRANDLDQHVQDA